MSGQGASLMSRIQSQLECPVCFIIPRELPVPSCPSGHIVCRPCKERVRDCCPTCRQPMPPNMTNSLAAALIDEVPLKCKYSHVQAFPNAAPYLRIECGRLISEDYLCSWLGKNNLIRIY